MEDPDWSDVDTVLERERESVLRITLVEFFIDHNKVERGFET